MLQSASVADVEPLDIGGVSVDHLERTTTLMAHRFILSTVGFIRPPE